MAEQHLFVPPSTEQTQTGGQFITSVQFLWTGGRSAIYSQALSLINGGNGIGVYGSGNWSEEKTFTWPGGGGWDLTWTSDDGGTTVRSKQTESVFNKTQWKDGGTHEINAANGDTYKSVFSYNSEHNLLPGDIYVGGRYSGGHTIEFTGLSGTPQNASDDEKATERVEWTSNVTYSADGVRNDQVKTPHSDLSYENSKYKLSFDTSVEYNLGLEEQANPKHVKRNQSGDLVSKNPKQVFNSYSFEDKPTGFRFECQLSNTVDFINDTANMAFSNIVLTRDGVEYRTPSMKLSMTAAEIDQISLGEEIGDDLGGIEGNIANRILPFVSWVTEDALAQGNVITTKTSSSVTIDAGDGDDKVAGGAGNDTVVAGNGNDNVNAGDGADLIIGGDGAGNDSYDGGKGIDTVKYTSALAAITVNLTRGSATSTAGNDAAGIGTDRLRGIENLIAGDFADTLIGSKDANAIDAGAGDDTIDGGLGKDTLTGGMGADRFVFSTRAGATNVDTVSDFASGTDKLVLSARVFSKLKGLSDLSAHFAVGAPTDANDFLVFDIASGRLSYDADGNGKGKAVDVAIIGGGIQLQATDFSIS